MSIEDDIQSKNFRNNYHKLMVNLIYTNNWLSEKSKELFASIDITPQQFNILRILRGSHPVPLSTLQIRERMLDRMSDTSRIVDRLVLKGLVKKCICKNDKRLVDVMITPKGQKILKTMDCRQDEMDSVLKGLSEQEAEQLSGLLDKVRSA